MTSASLGPANGASPKSNNFDSVWAVAVGRVGGPVFEASAFSNLLFNILSSFTAKSSMPNVINFPTSVDIPFSNCRGGSCATCAEFERVRKHAKATRAHSAVGLSPEDVDDADEGDLVSLVAAKLGELMARLRERGCRGEGGSELLLRSSFLEAVSLGRRTTGGFLIALLRLLSVSFMTCVASIDRSFGDN